MMFLNQPQASIFSDPYRAVTPGDFAPDTQTQTPFVWGQAGAHLTPDQLAIRQKQALLNQQPDYSPISSPWQGLARVAQNISGALDERSLNKQSAAIDADRAATISALLGGDGGSSAVAAALTSNDPVAQKFGMAQWERANPKPVNNDTVADFNFITQTLGPDAGRQYLQNKADPIVNIPQPGGGVYLGPRSGMAGTAQGATGGPVTKVVGGKTYYQVNGDWYDNPEGR